MPLAENYGELGLASLNFSMGLTAKYDFEAKFVYLTRSAVDRIVSAVSLPLCPTPLRPLPFLRHFVLSPGLCMLSHL